MTTSIPKALASFREQIDALDDQIVALLAERLEICRKVGHCKADRGIAVLQPDRVAQVKERNAGRGEAAGLRPSFTMALYSLIIDEACALEDEIVDD